MTAPESKSNNWRRRLFLSVLAYVLYLVTRLICCTYRITVIGKENEDQFLRQRLPILFVSWHQGILYYVHHFRNRNGIVMVSQSKDGELLAGMLKHFGFQSARGSSSAGGKQAMHKMIEVINATHCSGGLVADAPRGPFGVAKMGIIKIAKETGLPLIPVMCWAKNKILLRNWDRTMVPLPFTRLFFWYAPPIFIAPDTGEEQMEVWRVRLSERLNEMHRQAQIHVGDPLDGMRPE